MADTPDDPKRPHPRPKNQDGAATAIRKATPIHAVDDDVNRVIDTIPPGAVFNKSDFDATQDQDLKDLVGQSAKARQAVLVVVSGSQLGKMFVLPPGPTAIGRAPDANLVVQEAGVSRRHADIVVLPEEHVVLRDNNSTNGTLLNGEVVKNTAKELKDGDKIQVGPSLLLKFEFQDKLDTSFQRRLYDSAVRDGLTGAYNKRYLDERLEQEWAAHNRYGTQLSLLLLDVDHFKRVNDSLGHAAGDRVLQAIAHAIQRALRKEEVFARYGGEEFVILLRETTLEAAQQGAERMRKLVESTVVPWEGATIGVTISIGVACTAIVETASPKALVARADQLLYQAKQGGRNRWVSDPSSSGLPAGGQAADPHVDEKSGQGEEKE